MGLAVLYSRALSGMEAALVTVEVHIANGLPNFTIVGLPETEVKESKDRVRSALQNCHFDFPARRITVNLAPADLPKESGRFDLPIDYDSLRDAGAIMGSGGMIVMDEDTCMVDVSKFFIQFTNDESCGKCSVCRDGSDALLEVLTRITEGEGKPGDVEFLEELGSAIKDASMCGLGQTLPNPVLSTLKYFRDEYVAHVTDKNCPAKACKALVKYYIDPDKCPGCTLCLKNCPTGAIKGETKHVHVIDQTVCSKCGECLDV